MKIFHVVLAILVLSVISCKDDNPVHRISRSEHQYFTGPYSVDYEYDEQGRLILVNDSRGLLEEYTYTSNKVIHHTEAGQNTWKIEYLLNANGIAEKIVEDNGTIHDIVYNNDHQPIRIEVKYPDGNTLIVTQVWTNGNLTSKNLIFYNAGFDPSITTFTYSYLEQEKNTIGNEYKGLSFMGRDSKNPVLQSIAKNGLGSTNVTNYTYQFDDNGNIIQVNDDKYYYE